MDDEQRKSKRRDKTKVQTDTGWAWMVLLGAAVINFTIVGTLKSFGFFFVAFLEKYNCSVTVATLIGAMYQIVFIIVSPPLLTIGLNHMSVRTSCIIGSILFSLGYGLSSIAPNIAVLVLFQSVLCGGGDALVMPPAIILIGHYFEKRRGLANGLAFSCISLGSLVLPNLYRYLLDEYGLQGSLIITGGFCLHMLAASCLFRPMNKEKTTGNDETEPLTDEDARINREKVVRKSNINCDDNNGDGGTKLERLLSSHSSNSERSRMESENEATKPSWSSIENIVMTANHITGSMISLERQSHQVRSETSLHDAKKTTPKEKFKQYCLQYISLFRNVKFMTFLAAFCLGSTTTANLFTFFPHHAQQKDVDRTRTALLISIMSISDFIGRMLCGFLADRKCIKRLNIIIISQFVLCIMLYTSSLYYEFWTLVVFVVLLGFVVGMVVALFAPVMIDIIGIEKFPTGMSITIIIQSIFHGVALVLLGYLRDVTGNYLASFYFLASTSLIAAGILLVQSIIETVTRKSELDVENEVDIPNQ